MRGLKDKNVLITGGASGIGLETTKRFLDEGASVAILDQDKSAAERIGIEVPEVREYLVADVADFESVKAAFASLDGIFSNLDILINNAGISIQHPFLEVSQEDWERVISVNLNGAFFVAQQAARRMVKHGSGVIINMGSTNGILGYPNYSAYNTSKAGLIELTRSMALELAPDVRVVSVCPGYVLTPMQEAEYSEEMLTAINSKIPLGRHAQPEEDASLCAFLASDEASFMSGHTYVIDGGEIAGGMASR
jgi:NAD(P)-dependent dehydrogenase (short-subunit alcohol dehydrogenase family)